MHSLSGRRERRREPVTKEPLSPSKTMLSTAAVFIQSPLFKKIKLALVCPDKLLVVVYFVVSNGSRMSTTNAENELAVEVAPLVTPALMYV
jgi:hypothetical protein